LKFADVLLIGLADDGPAGVAVQPESWQEAQEIFGWWTQEIHTISASGTSTVLQNIANSNEWYIYQVLNNRLYSNPLYLPSLDSVTFSFGSPGTSGTYAFRYVREHPENSLLPGLNAFLKTGAPMPLVWRLSGVKASAQIGGISFTAKYCGTRYNDISISYDGATLTVTTPHAAKHATVSYTVTTTSDFVAKFNHESGRGKHAVEVSMPPSNTFDLPVGTWALTGGTDASFTEESILAALSNIDLSGVGLVVLCGGATSGIVSSAVSYVESQTNSTCIVVGSPVEYKAWDQGVYESYLNALPFTSNQLIYTAGWGRQIAQDSDYLYWTSLAPVFAGVFDLYSTPPTHKPTGLIDTSPTWTAAQLSNLGSKYAVATRFIQTGIGFFRSYPTGGRSAVAVKVLHDIVSRLWSALDRYIGESSIDIKTAEGIVGDALEGIENVRELSYECYLSEYTLTVKITVLVVGEVQTISFDVVTNK